MSKLTRPLSRAALARAGVRVPEGSRVVTEATAHKHSLAKAKAALRERAFLGNLSRISVAYPVPEFRFHETRKWRFDYAWVWAKLALEVDGGVWSGGKHGRGSGIVKDMEKLSEAAILGWRVLRVTPKDLTRPETADMVRRALDYNPCAHGTSRGRT